jgi:Flp pilus assembly protein protease CpaA
MLTYVPAAIALWLALSLFVVLWLGGGDSPRLPEDE